MRLAPLAVVSVVTLAAACSGSSGAPDASSACTTLICGTSCCGEDDVDVGFGEIAAVEEADDRVRGRARVLVDDTVYVEIRIVGGRGGRGSLDDVV